jgi:D-galactose 1-dehydrogenase
MSGNAPPAKPIRLGLVGIGKIAQDQHVPSIRMNPDFELVAAASRNNRIDGIANFASLAAMLDGVALDAVAICTPPQVHYEAVKLALSKGKHVLLEKPPCATVAELDHMTVLARAADRTLYQTWHSQHAHGVAPAARRLTELKLLHAHIAWKEDVRQWHKGQAWIWEPGGFGVFDPGINALSILTRIVTEPIFAHSADLLYPSNRAQPIAARLALATASGASITAELDFRQTGTQTWDIDIETDTGPIKLSAGGGVLTVGGKPAPPDPGALDNEYQSIYRRFAELVSAGRSDVDIKPLKLVADIFLVATRASTDPFDE